MTRKEILQFGKEIADKFFHNKHKEKRTIDCYIVRAESGDLYTFLNKPKKQELGWSSTDQDDNIPSDWFSQVKWEDDEPTPVEITIKLK